MGSIRDIIEVIPRVFIMFEPMTLEIARSVSDLKAATVEVTNSGSPVPMDMMTIPMMASEIPAALPRSTAPMRAIFAPRLKNAIPEKKVRE